MHRYFYSTLKIGIQIVLLSAFVLSCHVKSINQSKKVANTITTDTLKITNKALDYEIVIIDPGFTGWFNAYAKPRGYYSQQYLEARNREWVMAWNMRAANPAVYGHGALFTIDYQNTIDYGYEVNYMLYYYLTYFQLSNNIRLGSFLPRI